jgi:hypothetical protein
VLMLREGSRGRCGRRKDGGKVFKGWRSLRWSGVETRGCRGAGAAQPKKGRGAGETLHNSEAMRRPAEAGGL